MRKYEIIRVRAARRGAVVVDYANLGGGCGRAGWWAEDEAGGWGTSRHCAEDAIAQCASPRCYRTRRAAKMAADILYGGRGEARLA